MLIILIIFTILAVIICKIADDNCETFISFISAMGAVIFGIISLCVICVCLVFMCNGITATQKIEMYKEENEQIQNSIDLIVAKYMNYENDTFKELKSESPVTYVSLYPQLQSDELVKQQIDLYIENNNKIKELKEYEIDMKLGKWLLYFGW